MKLPEVSFYLFGMGDRRKFLYKQGKLIDALTGEIVREWDMVSEIISPADYRVELKTISGKKTIIKEDEKGVWLEENEHRIGLDESHINLPAFAGSNYAPLLRILHHEILINIVNGKPLPNFLVYLKPWYRDSAMMCMCLATTNNLHLVKDWICGLREPFDRNNGGNCEPDNLGQALYMISLVSDKSHPLVETILRAIPKCRKGNYIAGITDGAERPVYQTKWLKYGLRCLGLDDPYIIPDIYDTYSALFWMDYRKAHVNGQAISVDGKENYPYLGWAEAHFHCWPPPLALSGHKYPLTWEANASFAIYEGISLISQEYVKRRICAPHTWHAAEMFLYLLDS